MSRVLKVSNGDYRIQVSSTQTTQTSPAIILDTGPGVGTVTITGNLDVKGITTTVESTNTTIADNILTLNYGQTGSGISSTLGYQSGIEVVRGSRDTAQLLFTEQISHWDPTVNSEVTGTFVLQTINKNSNNLNGPFGSTLSGLALRTITTDGTGDLIFDLQNSTTSVIRLSDHDQPNDYANRLSNPRDIPNLQFLFNYVAATNGVASVDNIHYPAYGVADTSIQATATTLDFKIGNSLFAQISSAGTTFNNIRIFNDTILDISAVDNMVLQATNGIVEVNSVLNLDNQSAPSTVSGATRIWSNATAGPGNTGLYITNVNTTDELISKNRAVLYSIML